MRKEIGKFTFFGNPKEIEKAEKVLKDEGLFDKECSCGEGVIRSRAQLLIEQHKLLADISYDGNTIWNKGKVLKCVRAIQKSNDMRKMTKYFYEFLHLQCGSIAHYDMGGWIATYPSVHDLRMFFQKNEHGRRVINDIPDWHTDAKAVVLEIEDILGVPSAWSNPWKRGD